MSMNKRRFLKTVGALGLATSLAPLPVLAAGDNEPIAGINVILERDPSSGPIASFSLDDGEVRRFNRRMGRERAEYLAGIIALKIVEALRGELKLAVDEVYEQILAAMGNTWCGPCKIGHAEPQMTVGYNPETGAARIDVK